MRWVLRSQEPFPDCTNATVTKGFVMAHENAMSLLPEEIVMRSQESLPDCINVAVTKGFMTAQEHLLLTGVA